MNEMEPLSAEDQALVTQIKRKVDSEAAQAQQDCEPYRYPPASLEEVRLTEAAIGAKLPPLIRELFLQIGNGGFGPGYGITGLITGQEIYRRSFVKNERNTIIEIKAHLRESIATAEQSSNPTDRLLYLIEQDKRHLENWNRLGLDHLIWYCDWGCNLVTLVDYGKPEMPVYLADSLDVGAESVSTLRQWWYAWLNGSLKLH
ncbi:MAG: SMI1/KNR4 family protein [Anaerolineae bacterium]|nr:SMI1/KNR4 family protein [Anaerolineae bacterium]